MDKKRMSKSQKVFIAGQIIFIIVVIVGLLLIYPKVDLEVNGNNVVFKSINAKAIIISNNPDFSNSRLIEVENNISFNLRPGTYYWKASNGILEGFSKEFMIESEVGLEIIENESEKKLLNVGNVRINVTRKKDGTFIGHLILEPNESAKIDGGEYTGRQDGQ